MYLPEFYLVIFGTLVITQVALAIYLLYRSEDFTKKLSSALGFSAQQKESWSLWRKIFKKSQAVLGQAELEGIKIVAGSKFQTKQLETLYESQLKEAVAKMETDFAAVVKTARSGFAGFLTSLEKESNDISNKKVEHLNQIVDDVVVSFTKRLEEKLTEVDGQILKVASQEGTRVKAEVEDYRKSMLKVVDRDIAEMVEEVVKIVVGKRLTGADQMDLIEEALEQAKKDKLVQSRPL